MTIDKLIDKMGENEEIEVEKSVQIEPPKEYILIIAEPNSEEWEDLKYLDTLIKLVYHYNIHKKGE
jgi:hypothetical protein